MENLKNISGNFVFDMDEVLVDISPLQYSFIRSNWTYFSMYFKNMGPLTPDQVLARPVFYMDEWLVKDEYKNNGYEDLKSTVRSFMVKNYFETDMYGNLNPTKFAQRTIMNKIFMDHSRVNKVIILTKTVSDKMTENKKKFIKKWFNHPKVETVIVQLNEKKSDILKKHGLSWDLFVDDDLPNIIDFIENYDIKGKEFLIPKTGYNKIPLTLDILIKEKGGVYNYFDKNI
jgi:hypothetical protein